jgi:hypothetical protein
VGGLLAATDFGSGQAALQHAWCTLLGWWYKTSIGSKASRCSWMGRAAPT